MPGAMSRYHYNIVLTAEQFERLANNSISFTYLTLMTIAREQFKINIMFIIDKQ